MAISVRRLQRAHPGEPQDLWQLLSTHTPVAPTSLPPMTTGYRVSGTQILDSAGQPFVARGINVGGPKTDRFGVGLGANAQYIADVVAAGVNCVRLPNYATTRYGNGYVAVDGWQGATGVDAAVKYAKYMIDLWRAAGAVVIIDCHDFIRDGWTTEQLLQAEEYWAALANAYKSDSAVWFELYNEVAVYSSDLDGPLNGNVGEVRKRWRGLHARACKIIRDAGAPNIIICDGFTMAQDAANNFDGKPAPKSYDSECAPLMRDMYKNIVVGWHNYGARGYTQATIEEYIATVHAANLPVLITEFGYPIYRGWDDIASSWWPRLRDGFDWTMAVVPQLGVGLVYWSSAFGDGFSLYKPFWTGPNNRIINEFANPLPAGRSLSGQGVKYMQYLANGQAVPYSQSHSGGTTEE